MHTIDRYVLRQLVVAVALILFTLTLLAWFTQVVALLNILVEKGRSVTEFLSITVLLVPLIMGLIAPPAVFVASVFVLDRLNRDSELAVISGAGLSRWRLLRPFAVVAIVVTALVAFANLYFQPMAMHIYRDKLSAISTDLLTAFIEEGKFASPQAGIMVHVRATGPSATLRGIILEDTRDPDVTITYLARGAQLFETAGTPHILLGEGSVVRTHTGNNKVELVHFDQYSISLASIFRDQASARTKPSDMYITELLSPDTPGADNPDFRNKLRAEAHNRLSSPLYVIVAALLAFAFMSEPHTTRRSRILTIAAVTAVVVAVRVAGLLAVSYATEHPSWVWISYVAPLAAITLTSALIVFQNGLRAPRPLAPPALATAHHSMAR